MKIGIYTYSAETNLELAVNLIPSGIEPLELKTGSEVIHLLKNDVDIHLLLSAITDHDFLKEVTEVRGDLPIFLIIGKAFKPQDLIKLNHIGVRTVVQHTENTPALANSIVDHIFRLNLTPDERRKHIRIPVGENDKAIASVFLKFLKKFVYGTIVDISAGGVALQINDSLDASLLNVGETYDPVVLEIWGIKIRAACKVMGKRGLMVGLRFEHLSEKDVRNLSMQIYRQFTQSNRKFMKISD